MNKTLQAFLNAFALGLICVVSFIVLRPISFAEVASLPTELPEELRASFNKDVSEAIVVNQRSQLELLQKIDANVSKLIGAPTSIASPAVKPVENKNSVEVEVLAPLTTTTSRGIFRRGSVTRSAVGSAGK